MADDQVGLVKSKTDIVDLISGKVALKRAGRNFKAICPFHGEKTPSFFVSPEMQNYKCFGCGVGGDVLTFVMEYEGLTFPEALEQLAKKAGVELKREYRSSDDRRRDKWLEVLHLAAEYYHYILMKHKVGEKARQYLYSRKVTKQLIGDFVLGYAPDGWGGLKDFLVGKKGYEMTDLEQVGLVIRGRRGGYYDRFRGRVMFPLKDFSGRVVGFSGRVLDPHAKEAKYVNTPETKLYHKSDLLYGLYAAKQAIRENDRVIVVEGELDVLSSRRAGVKEVVAVKGSALTEGQVLAVRRLTKTIVLALDADEAGQEALQRGIDTAEKLGMNLRVVVMVGGKDPDEVVKQSPKMWREMVRKSVSVYKYYIDWALTKYDSASGEGVKKISQVLAPVLSRIENAVERAYYEKLLAERLGVLTNLIEEEVAKQRVKGRGREKKEQKENEKVVLGRRERLERYVLAVVLHFRDDLSGKLALIDPQLMKEAYTRGLTEVLREMAASNHKLKIADVREKVSGVRTELLQELYTTDMQLMHYGDDELLRVFSKSLRELKQIAIKEDLTRVSNKISGEEVDGDEIKDLQDKYRDLMRQLAE